MAEFCVAFPVVLETCGKQNPSHLQITYHFLIDYVDGISWRSVIGSDFCGYYGYRSKRPDKQIITRASHKISLACCAIF